MSSRTATFTGFIAILLWSTLALFTAMSGPVPAFQTVAMTFLIGGLLILGVAALRGRLHLARPTAGSLALGVFGPFGDTALYFAALKLTPPAEANLVQRGRQRMPGQGSRIGGQATHLQRRQGRLDPARPQPSGGAALRFLAWAGAKNSVGRGPGSPAPLPSASQWVPPMELLCISVSPQCSCTLRRSAALPEKST